MEPPEKPDDEECCNSGCNPCIFDVYEEQLKKYQKSIKGETKKGVPNCIKPLKYTRFKLTEVIVLTRTTNIYIFECQDFQNESRVFYKPGQHFLLKGCLNDEDFSRAYTPIPWNSLKSNAFAVLIKLYEDGRMAKVLKHLKLGSETLWRGPYGDFQINYQYRNVLFIAQGTGIAPIYSVINEMVENEECETFLKLFYCCRNFNEVFLRDQLYSLCRFWNFSYELFLSEDTDGSAKYNETVNGKLDDNQIKLYLDKCTDLRVVICGSESFNSCIENKFKNFGLNKENMFIF
ncbi:PREDICTED: NADH-cytochrome b5 reductase-like [Nicrophorus vespilloides]|uniref:NADH-cytochrome b5 reductase-like n=1 Tax=Nicrophorus vespilloides TaxID=110193 RepID=A0ABM1N4J1_NICVS|nr:PREDICTED: NADH-cytochrome b5 reductase-like [Nicrophorus vespilloides]